MGWIFFAELLPNEDDGLFEKDSQGNIINFYFQIYLVLEGLLARQRVGCLPILQAEFHEIMIKF